MNADKTGKTQDKISGPVLILIRGLPGSGKTYLAEALRSSIGSEAVTMLDPDKIDTTSDTYLRLCESLRAEGIEEKFFPNRFLKTIGRDAITNHKIIIWNQPFTDWSGFERSVDSLRSFAASNHIKLPIMLVEVTVSLETAKLRVDDRKLQGGHGPSEGRFSRFVSDYVSFAGKGYQTVKVNGEDDVKVSVETILTELRMLG